ncbi:helix-turn-helix domain-containing protein [Natronobacterium gregoryi]|uniref:Bacterio-opsin activator n=2 Tax=Natronobacterium gregoryi TaxID=44930 RepID=L0AD79_NATGS|nr:helix-turn-helix domain-containing protein [Natronobacterium gregoryi]AFZ71801.1 putative DNA binding protein [Natronobacterium gregoryi SP2]ELY72969.1 Bacterio-opsin activator HTH domain protein [Natronobacterium gregoryi SP2]PLK21019.1 bacterio-opsin activator [Natronobacterium gregoryi SP2]SFI87488.1 Predicted DNA binding protein, contains HTH domain [Natronobacterium gregoryi]
MSPRAFAEGTETESHGAIDRLEEQSLRVVLKIIRGGSCFIDGLEGDVVDVDVRLEDGHCHCDVSVRTDDDGVERIETRYASSEICAHCPGAVFSDHGCIPRYLGVGDGWFVVETYAADTDTVSSLVEDVRAVCDRVIVKSLVSTERGEHDDVCTIDVSPLTPKQREAVHHAVEAGYYDPATQVPLEDVAAKLEISPSALSQRLRRAESNIMRQVSEDGDD